MWSGTVSFGLVNVGVKLLPAVRHKDVRFHQLHASDSVRIQQKRVCPADGQEVPYDQLVKGYEISPGSYVVIDPAELEALDPESTHSIDIEDFTDLSEIDPLYFDASYYLVPDASSAKAYRLLVDAMSNAERVAIGRVVLRTKQYLCALRPVEDVLVLSTMNFADEVVDAHELEGIPTDLPASDRELKIAKQLIDAMSTDFDPTRYHDTYRQAVMELIEKKAAGEELVVQPEAPAPAPVIDLMEALEASLASAKKAGKQAADSPGLENGATRKRKTASR